MDGACDEVHKKRCTGNLVDLIFDRFYDIGMAISKTCDGSAPYSVDKTRSVF